MERESDLEKLRVLVNDAVKKYSSGNGDIFSWFYHKIAFTNLLLTCQILHYTVPQCTAFQFAPVDCCVVNYNTYQETRSCKPEVLNFATKHQPVLL